MLFFQVICLILRVTNPNPVLNQEKVSEHIEIRNLVNEERVSEPIGVRNHIHVNQEKVSEPIGHNHVNHEKVYQHIGIRCNPSSYFQQICPTGNLCRNDGSLTCDKDVYLNVDYCLCPAYNHRIHGSKPIQCKFKKDRNNPQICPTGHLCSPKILICDKDEGTCTCPQYRDFHIDDDDFQVLHENDFYQDSYLDQDELVNQYGYEYGYEYTNDFDPSILSHDDFFQRSDDHDIHILNRDDEHNNYEVHCNPSSQFLQICPSGDECRSDKLDCKIDSFYDVEYCICPMESIQIPPDEIVPPTHEVHCNPNSPFIQICPSGHICSLALECVKHSAPPYPQSIHCNPHMKQICPTGVKCSKDFLPCESLDGGVTIEYCECPAPQTINNQIRVELSVYDYCICPNIPSKIIRQPQIDELHPEIVLVPHPEIVVVPDPPHHHQILHQSFGSCNQRCDLKNNKFLLFLKDVHLTVEQLPVTNLGNFRKKFIKNQGCGCDGTCPHFKDCCDDYSNCVTLSRYP